MGLPEGDAVVWPKEGGDNVMMCDQAACRLLLKEHRVAFVRDREAVPMECAWADVLIAQDVINGNEGPADCAAKVVLDKLDGVRKGAHALWIGTDGVRVESAKDGQGQRPWAE